MRARTPYRPLPESNAAFGRAAKCEEADPLRFAFFIDGWRERLDTDNSR
jgi:hypothetical protein